MKIQPFAMGYSVNPEPARMEPWPAYNPQTQTSEEFCIPCETGCSSWCSSYYYTCSNDECSGPKDRRCYETDHACGDVECCF